MRRPFLRRTFAVLAALYVIGTIFDGIGLGWVALHPGRRPLTADDQQKAATKAQSEHAEFRSVEVTASDGATLRAWFIRPAGANRNAVILLHGVSDNRLGVYGYGDWLVKNHYTVLLPDARAHGVSGGEIATYGLKESDDIHQWVNWLDENDHPLLHLRPRRIYGRSPVATVATTGTPLLCCGCRIAIRDVPRGCLHPLRSAFPHRSLAWQDILSSHG